MTPPLRQRLGLAPDSRPLRHRQGDRGLMARSLMFLFFAGASIALLALIVGQTPADQPRMIATAASGFGIATLLLVGYDRLPGWAFPILLACGTMLIEWTIYSSGESTSAFAMFYFWIAIYAFYFFSRRMAVLQLLFIAASYAAVLAVIPDAPNPSVVRWAVTTSALVVAGAMIGLLKDRVDRLIGGPRRGVAHRHGDRASQSPGLRRHARDGARARPPRPRQRRPDRGSSVLARRRRRSHSRRPGSG
ncbi:MAG: hypothetical protein M3Z95_07040, partial [Actinomycetota bacterium]|nr:hypothetical protein [Actinomycetota bacterium]